MKASTITLFTLVAILGTIASVSAQNQPVRSTPFPYSNRFTLGGGVSQLLLGGFNVQAEYTTNRMVFDYSHGFNITLSGQSASLVAQDQKLSEKLTSTLGIGVGYRITPGLDLRFEPKLHFYEVYYDGQPQVASNRVTSYRTVTLGLGAYYRYYPFRKQDNALAGILVMPSVRYWPNVWSSLDNNKLTYTNRVTERTETYKAASQGFPGTGGLLANVTIGYTFGLRKK
ncbi:hypothetical protein BN8_02837 [Fibrisoma limi BUZ 3]|uniref:Outer membrane protein beta-barrel domain-containing protein n=1 Tax=Fibrisoma limi BUZ 3 TaxID=1185876 RepID=I2GIJ6_9BACT|nr:hypothetical protein [Fibrisoma limi]CCH53721.1 hypothetical protein BN8_02837 [Fibrisoma limi BUZ 3]